MKTPFAFNVTKKLLRLSACSAAKVAAFAAIVVAHAGAHAETVSYTMQTGNFNSLLTERNFSPPNAGTYNSGGSELANFANNGNFGNTPGAAAFRTFTINGDDETATARPLQVGDTFTITGYTSANPSLGGYLGISFRDSTTYTDFFSSTDNTTEARFQLDNTGGWKIYNGGTARDSGLGAGSDRTFVIKITSSTTFDAQVGGTWYYNNTMAASGGSIDSFSIYTFGDSNADSFWKNASLADTGTVQLGYAGANGTTYTPGVVSDGLVANSTTAVANAVFIGGDSGSAVLLNEENTYTGATTVNAAATARASHANAFGTMAGGVSVTSGGAIELSGGITVGAEALALNGTGISSGGALRNTADDNIWEGSITLDSASSVVASAGTLTLSGSTALGGNRLTIGGGSGVTVTGQISGTVNSDILKQGAGALTLSGDNSGFNPSGGNTIYVDQGTVYLAHNSAGGATSKTIDLGSGVSGAGTAALYAVGGRTIANPITIQGNNTTALTIGSDSTTEDNTFTGNITLEKTASFSAGNGRGVTFSTGALSGDGGLTKTGLGTVTLSGNNVYEGATVVSLGVLNLNAESGSAAGSTASVSVASGARLLISQSEQVNINATVSLSGGTIERDGGVSETFGNLTLEANSFLNFGSTAEDKFLKFGTLTLNNSSILGVSNFLLGNKLQYQAASEAAGQALADTFSFTFSDARGFSFDSGSSTFTITAIPEPSTYLAAAGLFALFLWPIRRRLLNDAKFLLGLRPTGRA